MSDAMQYWNCRICASKVLPDGFTHCPNCSHERDWDDGLVATNGLDPLRFYGREFSCCGSAYADNARFCAHCGCRLRRQRRPLVTAMPGQEPVYFGSEEREDEMPTLVPFIALEWLLQEA